MKKNSEKLPGNLTLSENSKPSPNQKQDTGETLSELKHYIENNGGNVVAVSTLGAAKGSTILL